MQDLVADCGRLRGFLVLRNDLELLFLVTVDGSGPIGLQAVPMKLDSCFTRLAEDDDTTWIVRRFRDARLPTRTPGSKRLLNAEEESFRLAAVRVSSGPRASLPVGKLPPALLADLRVCDARRVAGSPHRIGRLRDRYPKRVPRGGNGSDHVHAAHTHARPSIVGSTPVLLLPEFHRSR